MVFDNTQSLIFLIILCISLGVLIVTRKLMRTSFPYVFFIIVGVIFGLIVGQLLAESVSGLPGQYGRWLPVIVNVFSVVAVLDLFMAQAKRFSNFFQKWAFGGGDITSVDLNLLPDVLCDTSSLIDGRILEIVKSGFIVMPLAVPTFVIEELHKLSDSKDPVKKQKGILGLETLEAMKQNPRIILRIIEKDYTNKSDVDHKLILLAKERGGRVLTTDNTLNRSATIQGVVTLNINELATALKPLIYPGEKLSIEVVQQGKGDGQGVGYLSDGSMVVVEKGSKLIGKTVNCTVSRVFQTTSGRMLFVEIER
jgi:uncharacterized protein YacL